VPEVKYAFIVFRDMQAVEYILKMHQMSWLKRAFCMSDFASKYFPLSHRKVKKLYFFKNWLNPERASLPESVMWENLDYTKKSRSCRKTLVWVIVFVLIVISFIGITLFHFEEV
jgi:hypothetical protein